MGDSFMSSSAREPTGVEKGWEPADRPPLWFWLIPAALVLLRLLPVFWLQVSQPPENTAFIGLSYLPKDFLAYVAFIRQVPDDGAFVFANPFTTDPQAPRFILLFHWLVGAFAKVSGVSPITALEWSRVPLAFGFFAALWWFLRPFLPVRQDRLWASVLAGFAGGFESWIQLLAPKLPEDFAKPFTDNTWMLYGWNLFASFYNPLWMAALIIALVVLRPMLTPDARGLPVLLRTGVMFVVLYGTHPYTAIAVAAIIAAFPVVTLAAGTRPDWRRHGTDALVIGGALIVILALNRWQMQDPVYRASAGG
ncbi:MAG TPA: hypothetical protein VFA77_03575, partial [Candidatus Eisenbacteria bacterium]|nr:hypothetical protein [Candidatus Eisenbacteria bacterium]